MLRTRNNADSNKLVIFSGIALYYGDTCIIKWQCKESEVNAFATSIMFENFIPTYRSMHVCSRQALLCARLAACHVPLVSTLTLRRGGGTGPADPAIAGPMF